MDDSKKSLKSLFDPADKRDGEVAKRDYPHFRCVELFLSTAPPARTEGVFDMIGGTVDLTLAVTSRITYGDPGSRVEAGRDRFARPMRVGTKPENSYARGAAGPDSGGKGPKITRSTHVMEDGKLVFKRYDENGKLIQRVPPGYVPISEMV